MTNLAKLFTLGAFAAASASLASATTITPGGSIATTGLGAISVTNDGIVASVSGTLTAKTFTGTYVEYVIKDGSNPYGTDDLTFVIAVTNNASSPNGIEHVSNGDGVPSFAMFSSVNVGYVGGTGHTDVPVSVDETIFGTVEFNFTGTDNIAPGTGTEYLVIQTAATNFTTGNVAVIDSSSDTENGFIPAAATPEPNSLLLLGTGLVGGATTLLRRRRLAL